jgi:ribosomal-protein-alanine N-acetyltransferase
MKQKGIIRAAVKSDTSTIDKFLQQRITIHRHLDWRQPTDWLGRSPFLLYLSSNNSIEAILNCVSEPQDTYWIRLFAYKNPFHRVVYWKALFNEGLRIIADQSSNPTIASLAYQKWMKDLLEMQGWIEKQQVIQFKWDNRKNTEVFRSISGSSSIRQMTHADIREIALIDQTCFHPLWQQSNEALEQAYALSAYSTVFEIGQSICGFQVSTYDKGKAHLARLAVLPDFQKQHIGEQLVLNMLKHYDDRGIKDISVNTQQDNYNSIGLYNKLYFKKTGDSFPVYFYG